MDLVQGNTVYNTRMHLIRNTLKTYMYQIQLSYTHVTSQKLLLLFTQIDVFNFSKLTAQFINSSSTLVLRSCQILIEK